MSAPFIFSTFIFTGMSLLLSIPGVLLDSPSIFPFFIPERNVPDFRSSFLIRDSPALPIPIPPNDLLSNLLGALMIFLTPPTIGVAFPSDLLTRPTLPTDLPAMPTLPIDFSSPIVPFDLSSPIGPTLEGPPITPTLPSVLDFMSDDRPTLGDPSLSALKP